MIPSETFEYGYADNTPGGDKINITDAIDKDGNAVLLSLYRLYKDSDRDTD
ncbi:MAG: hypothetical protein WA749_04435 [Gelidibacter sp.]